MSVVTNGRLLFNEIPIGYPEPGTTTIYDDSKTIDLDTVPLNGGILVKTVALSIDPYLRSRMRDPQVKSYASAFIKGEPLNNFGIGKVIRSENSSVEVGQHIYGVIPFEHYFVLPDLGYHRVIVNEEKLPWHLYTGVLGAGGQTAWCAWKEWIRPKEGDVVFVTTGGGPVGSFLIQLAKEAGLKVIASAGSEEKIEFMKSIGADVTFNYKTERPADVLKREGPINIYWDNVGGESLEAALCPKKVWRLMRGFSQNSLSALSSSRGTSTIMISSRASHDLATTPQGLRIPLLFSYGSPSSHIDPAVTGIRPLPS